MTKQEIENEILKLQKMIDNGYYDNEIWKPNLGDTYYIITDTDDEVVKIINNNDSEDIYYFQIGNYFKTEQKAVFEARKEKYTRLFRKYIEENSEPCVWGDDSPKYFLYYDSNDKFLNVESNFRCNCAFQIFASNEHVLWDALKFIGEDNFKKYILEIEDEIR